MSGEPRTLHLTVRAEGGGTERNVRLLCDRTPTFERLAMDEVMGFPLKWRKLGALRREIQKREPEVVFCYGAMAHLAMALMFPFGKPPMVGNIRGEIDFQGKKAWIQRAVAWRCATWVSNSRKALGNRAGTVIYNGVGLPGREKPLLKDLRKPVIGMLASGNPVKGHRWFLELWTDLGKPGSLVFAGNLGEDLRREAFVAGVHCPGFVEAGPLLRSLDLLVVPSASEGMPTVLLEAMVREVPVMATPVGGIPELLEDGVTGVMRPREEWRELLARPEWSAWRAMAKRGREKVERDFSFTAMQRGFLKVARETVAGG